ncbi:porin OmpF2 [Yersinia pseudotuberculosis]|uniref:porin OmpF2 n=1 Tax=Yersinia pseudotuberculosis TaxID=633 RepID=UPI000345FA4F|nr:porin OmpF2 [Yersinia pseudotuberculosis]QES97715.1 porin OmpF2 [Yersinia pseudotuberculosis]CFU98762.1 outer membrane protein C2 [Yersinia pseudotuberculosis]CNC22049.1 outer membrane protein C2 [Yersinia pseudotuberculosis]CNC37406.1 outer membrane protein C2 [Yersinia pseudotuberculosis]CRY62586.1 outer membrane protein C2 [Yersinia pseudotuberculosis]
MKRNILAILIPTLLVATTSHAAEIYNKDGNKLDLYGKVKALHYFSDNTKSDGDKSYVRLGFKGVTQITDELSGYGQWEYNFAANYAESQEAKDNKTRLAFAGLRYGNLGSIDYGRNYGVLYDIAAWTDMLPEFGNDSYTRTDNFMTGRTTGVATYRNTDFFGLVDGLKFSLQYQGKNGAEGETNNGRADTSKQNGDGFGLSSSYEIGAGVSVGAAYASSNRTLAQKNSTLGKGDKADAWTTGLKYSDNGVYLAANYAETRNMTPISGNAVINNVSTSVSGFANKTQNIELVAQYLFDFGLKPSIAYIQSKGKDIEGIGDTDLVKYVDIGATYYFNKNMSTYVDYKINQLNDDNKLKLNTDNVVALGLVYQF